MIKKLNVLGTLFTLMISTSLFAQVPATLGAAHNHIDTLVYQLYHPQQGKVLVASHRGDWRNAPENSIQGLQNSIAHGVDVMEIDLKLTQDGKLVLMHDNTIDRTMTGKGKPADYTLAQLKNMYLRAGQGVPTEHAIPTFKEFLAVAKGKILIDVDKCYPYLPQVIQELKETGTLQQAILNIDDNTPYQDVVARYGKLLPELLIMPIISYKDSNKAKATIQSYLQSGHKNVIFQPVWSNDASVNPEDWKILVGKKYNVWLNSLWASLCGAHNDDRAVEKHQEKETWGWLIENGATILQTDRPQEMLRYLGRK